jgi:uncharacterized protein with ATP-grasp and redox domains
MWTYLDCVPCFIRQALDAARFVSEDEVLHERVLRRILDATSRMEFDNPPPYMGGEVHRIVREETGSSDPYEQIKRRSTVAACALVESARDQIDAAPDPFDAAVRFAIAGNVMDFALSAVWDEARIKATFADALTRPIARSEVGRLKEDAETAALILYIGDNAGETVLDGLLLERLSQGRVTYVVKGGPVVNDATREDAHAAGIGDLARIVDTGSDAPGVILKDTSQEFRNLFRLADLVIAKGQANYESLSGSREGIYFLTQVKCAVVARDAGASVGDWLCTRSAPSH